MITPDDARAILQLRLLVARAANQDSLSWWDDSSLTPSGAYLLERLFPMAPDLAARKLALHAAGARHRAAFAGREGALHLYSLDRDSQDDLALRQLPLRSIKMSQEPLPSMAALRQELLVLTRKPAAYTRVRRSEGGGLEIEIPPAPGGVTPLLHQAQTLAWAYLEGEHGAPVFPFWTE